MSSPYLRSVSICDASFLQLLYVNPVTSRVFLRSVSICGAKFRMLTIVDSVGAPIENATITIADSAAYTESGLSLADGTYSSYLNGTNLTNPLIITVAKTGLTTFTYSFTMITRIDWVIQMVTSGGGGRPEIRMANL
jgi:hypothetical protein